MSVRAPNQIKHDSNSSIGANGLRPGGFELRFHWRILGSHAPVFPGFEIDICDRVSDADKPDAIWHRQRARGILRDHPEVKQLFGRNRWTAVWCLGIAALQLGIAIVSHQMPWWLIIAMAYTVGTIANIALFNLAHECNHGLVFKQKRWNRWLFTLTSMPMLLPAHHTWWIEHHVHHNELGAPPDFVKRRRSILLYMKDRVLGHPVSGRVRDWLGWLTTPLFWPIAAFVLVAQFIRSVIGLIVYAAQAATRRQLMPSERVLKILADAHLVSGYRKYGIEGWAVAYPLLSFSTLALVWWFCGLSGIGYLGMSALFMAGFLHPLAFGCMLSNSHFHGVKVYQPTSSCYGWLNWLTFNFGLHTEHHDLAAIPWNRLGQLRQIAPDYYDRLVKTNSFSALAFKFAFQNRDDFNNEEHRNFETTDIEARIRPEKTFPSPEWEEWD